MVFFVGPGVFITSRGSPCKLISLGSLSQGHCVEHLTGEIHLTVVLLLTVGKNVGHETVAFIWASGHQK